MDVARHTVENRLYTAQEFGRLPDLTIAQYRRQLICDGCKASAYFSVKHSSGKSFFFGARPHNPGCEFATVHAGDVESANLFKTARLQAEDGIVKIVPDRLREGTGTRFVHDPDGEVHDGNARRYARSLEGSARTIGTIQMKRLLRRLLRDPAFASSDEQLKMEDLFTTVRSHCVELRKIEPEHLGLRRLYWGSVVFCEPVQGGGAWLHTASGLPSVRLSQEVLDMTFERTGCQSTEGLDGASFLVWTWLSRAKNKPRSRPFLMASKPHYFTLRLAHQDPIH